MTDEMKKNEVTEEQLEGVAGGGSWSTYSSGDTPKFRKGQRVLYKDTEVGTVKEVSTGKSGVIYKEFTYTIEIDGVYEKETRPVMRDLYGDGHWFRTVPSIQNDVWESDLKLAGDIVLL